MITILDGGMGKELARIGAPFRQPEWSALALIEDPDSVVRAHRNFIEAGADLIIANSYAVVPFHIGSEMFEARGAELARLAGSLARIAADASDHAVRVAGSVPPLFGSYEPDRFDGAAAPALYDVLVRAQAPSVDIWIGETIGCRAEAEAVMASLDRVGVSGERWLSFSLDDDLLDDRAVLWSGESVAESVRTALDTGADAILFNCSTPESISVALPELFATLRDAGRDLPVGVYANAFPPRPDEYAANEVVLGRRADLTPETHADCVGDWIAQGVTIVGGCCGMHPEHIAELVRRFSS